MAVSAFTRVACALAPVADGRPPGEHGSGAQRLVHLGAPSRQELPTADAVRAEHWWNLWRRRQQPYTVIADGVPVVLLNSWPASPGELGWLVRATNVHTDVFPDKTAAIRAIAKWAGQTPRWVRADVYSVDKPDDARNVIYWRADPVCRLGVPRPAGLAVRRNGWAVTDTAALAGLGVDIARYLGGGQGKGAAAPRGGQHDAAPVRVGVWTRP